LELSTRLTPAQTLFPEQLFKAVSGYKNVGSNSGCIAIKGPASNVCIADSIQSHGVTIELGDKSMG
jgi:hypothetical protein